MVKMKLPAGKLSQDIAWTIGSFVVLALSGISINIIVAALRGAPDLGVFNQTYAVYIVASQIAALGIHYSVLRNAAYFESEPAELTGMFNAALLLATVLGILTATVTWLLAPILSRIFDSAATGEAIKYAAWGLSIFSVNKVIISHLNGLRRMRAFSVLQASRYLSITFWVALISTTDRPIEESCLCFLVGEAVTFSLAAAYMTRNRLARSSPIQKKWISQHLTFGSKSILAGMFVELNSRIDVLLIGTYMSDRAVGIYSFAAMLVDGVYQLLSMVRVNLNPVLVSAVKNSAWDLGQQYMSRAKSIIFSATFAINAAIIICFQLVVELLFPGKSLSEGIVPLIILLGGLTLVSAFIPFDNLLMVSGFPGLQTMQHLTVVICNTLFNIMLIPKLGLAGAAFATAISYLVGIAALLWLVRRKLGWNLLTNTISNHAPGN
jgi:O-antigen/teichoic acid export membrane protein